MKRYYKLMICLIFVAGFCKAQDGHIDDFDDISNWQGGNGYTLSHYNEEELQVSASNVGATYQSFSYSFPTLDLRTYPHVQVEIRSGSGSPRVRIDLEDVNGNSTNLMPSTVTVNNEYTTYTYSYAGRFRMGWSHTGVPLDPAVHVNPQQINRLIVYLNDGGNPTFTGSVFFRNLRIGSETDVPPPPTEIKLNQIGFYPEWRKNAVVASAHVDNFHILSEDMEDVVFEGELEEEREWGYSGERVRIADFSSYKEPGKYYLRVGEEVSPLFTIENHVHLGLSKGLIKSFYYNRASMAIEAPYGEDWVRPLAHPDDEVLIHSSAASTSRPTGTIIESPRGWYDAGDYNKYVVNSGITTYSMLALYEHFPKFFDTLKVNIPETNNNLPDILDEALWNVRWLLITQDPNDWGVYHKITDADFSHGGLPHEYNHTRYAVKKSTAATLNFAAVMAQSYRIFSGFEDELPGLADSCINAALRAYSWAEKNPGIFFTNPSGISTGEYDDTNVRDEFVWAEMELYAATRDDQFYKRAQLNSGFGVPGWRDVNSLGLVTLVHNRKRLNTAGYADTTTMKTRLKNLADGLKNHQESGSAYKVSLGMNNGDFNWGSNAIAGNQGLILLQQFKVSGDSSFLYAALANLDYVMGRNGLGFSFVTGFGSNSPMNPHHRISNHSNTGPVPGMVVGGPNPNQNDRCPGYPSSMPALSYVDSYCSWASNEPAINYTAAVAYLAGGIEAVFSNATYTPGYTEPKVISSVKESTSLDFTVNLFPNPASSHVKIRTENAAHMDVLISDFTGKIVMEMQSSGHAGSGVEVDADVSGLPAGIYFVTVISEHGKVFKKLIVQ
ncbi:MAG: glycoside hydrolase family 9 protein [Cytophagaceae bacterium]